MSRWSRRAQPWADQRRSNMRSNRRFMTIALPVLAGSLVWATAAHAGRARPVRAAAAESPAAPAAAGAYTLVTEPADNYQQIYSFINSATKTLDMTMYELSDTTAQQDLAADASRGVTVRVILDQNLEKSN